MGILPNWLFAVVVVHAQTRQKDCLRHVLQNGHVQVAERWEIKTVVLDKGHAVLVQFVQYVGTVPLQQQPPDNVPDVNQTVHVWQTRDRKLKLEQSLDVQRK